MWWEMVYWGNLEAKGRGMESALTLSSHNAMHLNQAHGGVGGTETFHFPVILPFVYLWGIRRGQAVTKPLCNEGRMFIPGVAGYRNEHQYMFTFFA